MARSITMTSPVKRGLLLRSTMPKPCCCQNANARGFVEITASRSLVQSQPRAMASIRPNAVLP